MANFEYKLGDELPKFRVGEGVIYGLYDGAQRHWGPCFHSAQNGKYGTVVDLQDAKMYYKVENETKSTWRYSVRFEDGTAVWAAVEFLKGVLISKEDLEALYE